MKILLYCTKAKPQMYRIWNGVYELATDCQKQSHCNFYGSLNGKIIGECEFEVEEIKYRYDTSAYRYNNTNDYYYTNTFTFRQLEERSCLTNKDLLNYLGQNDGYAIHIKNLKIYDKPRELSDYRQLIKGKEESALVDIKKAPQNMMYACGDYQLNQWYILISIRPEWLCKILNGEKTIEVRKKVLKEMV